MILQGTCNLFKKFATEPKAFLVKQIRKWFKHQRPTTLPHITIVEIVWLLEDFHPAPRGNRLKRSSNVLWLERFWSITAEVKLTRSSTLLMDKNMKSGSVYQTWLHLHFKQKNIGIRTHQVLWNIEISSINSLSTAFYRKVTQNWNCWNQQA